MLHHRNTGSEKGPGVPARKGRAARAKGISSQVLPDQNPPAAMVVLDRVVHEVADEPCQQHRVGAHGDRREVHLQSHATGVRMSLPKT
ncbi:hypothetical protein GCM10009780_43990 [Actinomadura alba]